MAKITRDTVFVAGGQPSTTYVDRKNLDIERQLARALAAPNKIVSLAGPSKTGKTVLCRKILDKRQFVWVEGGQVQTSDGVWEKICSELNFPAEVAKGSSSKTGITAGIKGMIFSASGSQLESVETKKTFKVDNVSSATQHLIKNDIHLIIDDFHYIRPSEERREFIRSAKAAVFAGLRLTLLSVQHRAFDAIKAEPEMTGRFSSVSVPEWSAKDLLKIPTQGFGALNIICPKNLMKKLATECQDSPFLMQQFCWEICYDLGIDTKPLTPVKVPSKFDLEKMFIRLSKDSGLPVYKQLVAGPQIRKSRKQRPLHGGGTADVYEATLRAIADTGPLASVSYENLRLSLGKVLSADVPRKNEVTSVLKQLSKISHETGVESGTDVGLDWDNDRTLEITDPYLRFYLRWQVRKQLH